MKAIQIEAYENPTEIVKVVDLPDCRCASGRRSRDRDRGITHQPVRPATDRWRLWDGLPAQARPPDGLHRHQRRPIDRRLEPASDNRGKGSYSSLQETAGNSLESVDFVGSTA